VPPAAPSVLAAPARATARVASARPALQAKLEVGPAGDHYERQADSVAASVMRGSGPATIPPTITPIGGAQRKAVPPPRRLEEEKPAARSAVKAQRKAATAPKAAASPEELKEPSAGKASKLQRKAAARAARPEELKKPAAGKPAKAQREAAAGAAGGAASASVDASIQAMRSGPAASLDGSTRSFMENRFGRDFAGVRVHHDDKAAAAAQAIGARAFTTGNDIFFNSGEYQPNSSSGRQLIAHELTHTVQQGGSDGATAARTRIQRTPPTPPPPTAAPADPGSPPATQTLFDVPNFPGAKIDITPTATGPGTITLPVLKLPQLGGTFKGTVGGAGSPVPAAAEGRTVPSVGTPFVIAPPRPKRAKTVAATVWLAGARAGSVRTGLREALNGMKDRTPDAAPIVRGSDTVYYLSFRGTSQRQQEYIFSGTLDELANSDALLRPQWSPGGNPLTSRTERLDADHILEAQLGGFDDISNMWLLKASVNRSVGPSIENAVTADLNSVIAKSQTLPIATKPSQPAVDLHWTVVFQQIRGGDFPNTDLHWTRAQVEAGAHLEQLKIMNEEDLSRAGIQLRGNDRLSAIRVFPEEGGGRSAIFPLATNNQLSMPAFFYDGVEALSATYLGAGNLAATGGNLMRIQVRIFKTSRGKALIQELTGPVDVKRSERLGLNGYVSKASIFALVGESTFVPLSPLTFSDIGISSGGELVGTGSVLSSKALFPQLNANLALRGTRIMMDVPVPQANFSMGPLRVTETTIGIGVGESGFFVEGAAAFQLGNLGSGSVLAEISEAGPRLSGTFNLAMDFLNPASVSVTYDLATDTLVGLATLGVQQGRIPGVESGLVTVNVTREAVSVNGTLNLGGPLRGTSVNVSYTEAEGLKIGAQNIQLPLANLPAVQNATLSINAQKPPDGGDWIFSGTGTATLAAPGATGTLGIEYLNGLFTVTGQGQVARGPATGTLNFTATNRQIDEEGHPIEGPPIDGIIAWGRGSVTVAFGNILTGTAGIEYTPDNRVIISGAIALPPTYPVFPRQDYNRDLFTLSPPEFPIWGVSVAGIGVGIFAFVDARVAFNAFVGPGEIRNAQIGATMDLDRPEDATVTGHGEFHVPAYAGLTLNVGGGLRARATVAYAEGRVGLVGALGVEAGASAAIDISWSRQAGLALSADLRAEARPKFELSAEASVAVGVDLLVTEASHTFGPWRRVLGSFGPDMTLGVSMPVRWSEASGLDLSLDNIEVTRPSLDATALMTSVFDQLAA
jgi:hypothetical protein